MINLANALLAWGSPDFNSVLKQEIQQIDKSLLPLQQGLSQSSYVGTECINAVILNISESTNSIYAKTGIFYSGVIAGSCCADDPTPIDEQSEYCELQFDIDKQSGDTLVTLIQEN